jgi:capsular polysaccharide transport system permease protein
MYRSWKAQLRVLTALTLREIQSQNSSLDYGYAWALIDVGISIAAITVLKVFIHVLSPNGMPPVLFLVSGILPWLTFQSTASSVETTITRGKRLLLLPDITPLDLVFAKALQILCTYGAVFVVAAVGCSYFENASMPRSLSGVILIYLYSWILGIAYGLVTMPLIRVFPPASKVLGIVWRFGLLLSGVFFVITMFPEWTWAYLSWNPMIHVSELMRTYWFSTYQTPIGSPLYLAQCLGVLAILGLSLERYVRRRVPA